MEDLFQIIIIVIFIATSILSSIKKKKKAEASSAQKPKPRPIQNRVETKNIPQKQKTGAEILEQILGFKLEIPEPPKKEAPNTSYDNVESYDTVDSYDKANSYDSTWNPEESYKNKTAQKVSEYQRKSDAVKDQLLIDKQKYKSNFGEVKDEDISKESISERSKILKLMSERENLKDYIIISEILNKPKALRNK